MYQINSGRMSLLILFLIITIIGTACASEIERYAKKPSTEDGVYGSTYSKDNVYKSFGTTHIDENQHHNTSLEYSTDLTKAVGSIKGVGTAFVFLTDKNAYAAILLDNSGIGMLAQGNIHEQNNSAYVYNDKVIPKIATPYKSNLSVNDYSHLSDSFKQKIAEEIRKQAPHVEEVHISANMQFVNHMSEYAQEAWAGRPLEPWIEQFNILVQHQFAYGKVMPHSLKQLKD